MRCRGGFSDETLRLLRADFEANGHAGNAWISQLCSVCGTHVVADNKAGQWVPRTHDRPLKRKMKDGGYKRSNK